MITEIKSCLECGDSIKGRSDKKFCSDQCRVTYNNRLNAGSSDYVRSINQTLRRNWKILSELNTGGKTRTKRDNLIRKGFDFSFFTNTYTRKDGAIYYYCYEQGYLPLTRENYLLVTKKKA